MTTTGIQLSFAYMGNETPNVPVKVEIFDSVLNRVEVSWLKASDIKTFEVSSGMYGVRASLASGVAFDRSVTVEAGKLEPCSIYLHQASPHESHEWAYLTQTIDASGTRLLSEPRYEGVWLRMWQRSRDGAWKVVPVPIHNIGQGTWDEDGVTYRFRAPKGGFYMIQVGGPRIPWKNVALPSSYEVMVLVRPATGPLDAVHPLDVIVSSGDWGVESMLSFMQRGDISSAQGMADQPKLAEELLYSKYENTNAAAVGGYFLLKVRDLERLHNWANNLAEWFEWMPDGAIIHAWQLIMGTGQNNEKRTAHLDQARKRLLEAVGRGVPVYTEGLRLLRDGLLYFDSRAQGKDAEIAAALTRIGAYAAAADWSVSTTTFTGKSPDVPDARPQQGTPREKENLIYIYDVPLPEILRRTPAAPGERFVCNVPGGMEQFVSLNAHGKFELEDGRLFRSAGALQKSVAGDSRYAWWSWRTVANEQYLDSFVTNLRLLPEKT